VKFFFVLEVYRDGWTLVRRLFLVDNISGRQEASSAGERDVKFCCR